jgi:hypothetical protein
MSCSICEKRPPKRYCPAKGEKICALCCGREREVTIDCPSDCSHLIAARRYEAEHREPPAREEFPYPDVEFPPEFVYENWQVVGGIAGAILQVQRQNTDLRDSAVFAALEAQAETYRTLGLGIYYERPPDAVLARAVYARISAFLKEFRQKLAEQGAASALKDSDVFQLFVFLLRIGKRETSGRPLSRAYLAFLNASFPQAEAAKKEASRIIIP